MALTPDYLDTLPDTLVELWRTVEDDILRDVARRIAKMDGMTSTAQWQLWRLAQTRALHTNVATLLARYSGKSNAIIRRLLRETGAEALSSDDALYEALGFAPSDVNTNPALLNLLQAGYRQTLGTWKNLTATTARTVTRQFENELSRAWLQVSSGAFDYKTAIKRAVDTLAQHMDGVTYPSGHRDTLEVAVRRAVLTGVNQTAAKLQLARAEEMGCEFVEVSAHAGARPDHALWQGKVYHRGGAITYQGKRYADFEEATGYGTGAGLCGWNCRHNFYPFFPGLSKRAYGEDELAALNAKTESYNGKQYTKYEISQMRRALERKVRSAKKQFLAEDAAGLDTSSAAAKLGNARRALNGFVRDTGGKVDGSRAGVSGFGRSAAKKAAWAEKKSFDAILDTAAKGGKIILSEDMESFISTKPFAEISLLQGKLSDRAVRKWYLYQDSKIFQSIDGNLPIEDQAEFACRLRNDNRTRARDLMRDQETRKKLDITDPNKTFEELIADKMLRKAMSREEAIADIIKTASKTRASINTELGLR